MDVSARVGRLQKQLSKAKAKGNEIDTFIKAYDDDQETIAKLKRIGKVSELMAETQGKMAKEMTEKNKVLTQQVATLQAKNASCDEASLNNLEAEVARLRKDLEASQRLSKTAEKKMNEASLKEIGLEKLRKNDQKDAHEAKSSANKLQNEACNRPHPNQPTAALTGCARRQARAKDEGLRAAKEKAETAETHVIELEETNSQLETEISRLRQRVAEAEAVQARGTTLLHLVLLLVVLHASPLLTLYRHADQFASDNATESTGGVSG